MSNPLITQVDRSKIFLGQYTTDKGTYTNSSGDDVDLVAGTLIGREHATNKVKPCDSSATDGSQDPIGILFTDYTVANGDSKDITYAIRGEVDASMLTYADGDSASTLVVLVGSDSQSPPEDVTVTVGTMKDRLQGRGFTLKTLTEMTVADNE